MIASARRRPQHRRDGRRHLDSVAGDPGINDNVQTLRGAVGRRRAGRQPRPPNTLPLRLVGRRGGWSPGSTQYINGLSAADRDRIALTCTPTGRFTELRVHGHDGDQSGFPAPSRSRRVRSRTKSLRAVLFDRRPPLRRRGARGAATTRRSSSTGFRLAGVHRCRGRHGPRRAGELGGTPGAQFDRCPPGVRPVRLPATAWAVNSDAIAFVALTDAYAICAPRTLAHADLLSRLPPAAAAVLETASVPPWDQIRRRSIGDTVYVPDWAGNLYAVDKNTGQQQLEGRASPPRAVSRSTTLGPRPRSPATR